MRGWKIKDGGNYLSKEVNDYEVTIERKVGFHHIAIWKGKHKELIEEQDVQGVTGESEMRAIKLGDQLVKQLRGKGK